MAICCSVVQCVAVCVCVRERRGVEAYLQPFNLGLQAAHTHANVLHCVAVWCLVVEWFARVVQGGTVNVYVKGVGGPGGYLHPFNLGLQAAHTHGGGEG